MKRKRTLKQQPSIKLKRKMALVYATAGIAIFTIVGIGLFFYLNLGPNTQGQAATADFTSNSDGSWVDNSTWIGGIAPATSGISSDIEIFEFVIRSGDLSYGSGSNKTLIISDTLVVIGNLTMGNKSNVTINENGVLIVTGNFEADNKISVGNGGIIAVGGDLIFPTNNQDSYSGSTGDLYVAGSTSGNTDAESSGKDLTTFEAENPAVYEIFEDATSGTLPVTLTYFKAEPQEKQVKLSWETAEEINNDFFTIERSADGLQFEKVITIKGSGNSHQPKSYSYSDPYPLEGVSYYRLRQTDFDGQFEVFNAVAVSRAGHSSVDLTPTISSVAPNPFTSSFRVEFDAPSSGSALIQLMDFSGTVVLSESIDVFTGRNQHEFYQTDQLKSGIYLLQLILNGNSSKPMRVIKR